MFLKKATSEPIQMKHMDVPFEVKEVTEDGTFSGYGSTFGGKPDSYGDVMVEGCFSDTLLAGGRNGNGVALLYQHNPSDPVGTWEQMSVNKKGLKVDGKLVKGVQRADEAHLLLKAGALKGLSIGYNTIEYSYNKDKTICYLEKVDLWEISLVTFPANTRATITGVKSLIETAQNERELEQGLRESGLSAAAAKYIISLMDTKSLRDVNSSPWVEALKKIQNNNNGGSK